MYLLALVQDIGLIVNIDKSELMSKQSFDFTGYHFLLHLALVRPTQARWIKLQETFHRISKKCVISARALMSTIGLLAFTEKTVKLARIQMTHVLWYLKVHWIFYLFIWGFTSLSTLYRSYHDG